MQIGAYAMANIVPYHREAVFFHVLLHRMGDVGDTVTKTGELHPLPERLLRHGNEPCRLVADLSAGIGARAVPVDASDVGAHIHTDDVAFLENLIARNPMDDFIVHRNTGGGGEAAIPQEGGGCPLAFDEFTNCSIYFQSGYARTYHFARQSTGRRGNLSCSAHPLNISGRL